MDAITPAVGAITPLFQRPATGDTGPRGEGAAAIAADTETDRDAVITRSGDAAGQAAEDEIARYRAAAQALSRRAVPTIPADHLMRGTPPSAGLTPFLGDVEPGGTDADAPFGAQTMEGRGQSGRFVAVRAARVAEASFAMDDTAPAGGDPASITVRGSTALGRRQALYAASATPSPLGRQTDLAA